MDADSQQPHRPLIGPELLPAYRRVLAICLAPTAAAVLAIAAALRTPPAAALLSLTVHELILFGIVTLVFAAEQRSRAAGPVARYLDLVRDLLPGAQREDIIRELAANIQAQVEDREAALGRSLAEAEVEAILERLGDPMTVAGRFRPDEGSVTFGRQLIGPVLFPIYVKVLALNLVVAVTIGGAIAVAGRHPLREAFTLALFHVALQFVIVTVIFALVERFRGALFQWKTPVTPP